MRDATTAMIGADYRIAIITAESTAFPDMQHFLGPKFKATLAQTENEIQSVVDDADVRAVLLDLDSIGEDPSEALLLLHDIRQVRDDLVLIAITRSNSRSVPLKSSQAGADEFFLLRLISRNCRLFLLELSKNALCNLRGFELWSRLKTSLLFAE